MSSYLKILFLFLISIALCTTSDNSKNHKSDKHYNKQTKHKADLCLKFDSSAHVTKLCRRFKLINSQSANSNNDQRQQQLALLKSIEDSENSPCDETNKTITLKWSYQFIEEAHCVRVELNFSNVTSFKRKTNFNYYAFSYREITKNNVYLNRHPVNDSVNSLAVLKAHLKPYVICVTFFKNPIQPPDNSSNSTNSNNDLNCNESDRSCLVDESTHDIDMCIDIDTRSHFLSPPTNHDGKFKGINRELLMVLFITCLSGLILFLICIGHYVIERPRKRKVMLNALRSYLQKKNPNGSPETTGLMNSSSQAIFKDTNKGNNSGPTITITDCSSSHTLNDEPKETDTFLNPRNDYSMYLPNSGSDHSIASNQHKVTFVIGETIMEEPSSEAMADASPNDDADTSNNSNPNEESLKSVSHLLDDKPWLNINNNNNSSSQRIISRNNSISSQSNNNH